MLNDLPAFLTCMEWLLIPPGKPYKMINNKQLKDSAQLFHDISVHRVHSTTVITQPWPHLPPHGNDSYCHGDDSYCPMASTHYSTVTTAIILKWPQLSPHGDHSYRLSPRSNFHHATLIWPVFTHAFPGSICPYVSQLGSTCQCLQHIQQFTCCGYNTKSYRLAII